MGSIPGYKILSPLGKGGMASVYLAVQMSCDRKVALKIMLPALLTEPSFAQRFLREAKTNAQLNHRHIVAVYDVGRHEKYHYIAMELLSDRTLRSQLKNGPLDTTDAERILQQIAQALDYAASRQIIHRDLKPDNIMFREDGDAVLTDFGIAKSMETTEQITRMGAVLGTPRYMSPEQHRGLTLDHRSDLYSLGVVFYEMLTGEPPYGGTDAMAIGLKHVREPIPLLPRSLRHYQPLIKKLMAKEPEQRFESGAAIIEALSTLDRTPPPQYAPAPPDPTPTEPGNPADATPAKPAASTRPMAAAPVTGEPKSVTPGMKGKEEKIPGGWVRKRLLWRVFIAANDFQEFQPLYEELRQDLTQWHEKRRKQCAAIIIKATIHPWIAGRVADYIKNLRKSETHAFMQDIPVELILMDGAGNMIEKYRMLPEGNESPADVS